MQKLTIEALIASAYSEGQAWFGDLRLDRAIYAKRIGSIVQKHLGSSPSQPMAIGFVMELHGRDLYLSTACAQYSPGVAQNQAEDAAEQAGIAWKKLETTYKSSICEFVRSFFRASFVAADLAENIIADLFLPDRSGTSRIASYDGRSSLSTWLRTIICNRGINAQRCTAFSRSTELHPEFPDEPALQSFELTLRARRYERAVADSLAAACRNLTHRERLMLLWRYEEELQLGEIARMLGIHQSNVTRQLERLQRRLREEVIGILSAKHGLSEPAIEECLADIVENPCHEISILDFVKAVPAAVRKEPIPVVRATNYYEAAPGLLLPVF